MTAKQQRRHHRRKPYRSLYRQRGIVLLVVVSLITLFLLIGITFAVVAVNYREAAVKTSQSDLLGDNPEHELDNVFRLILRDSKSPPVSNPVVRNCLTWHSLLLDLYGVDGIGGHITAESDSTQLSNGVRLENPQTNGQVIHFTARQDAPAIPYKAGTFSKVPDYYNGRILTFIDGDAAGLSTRVMKYEIEYVSATILRYHFWVSAFDASTDLPSARVPGLNSRFYVNGAPFNGTGFGYSSTVNPANPNLDQFVKFSSVSDVSKQNIPVALLPNFWGYPSLGLIQESAGNQYPLIGGPDEGFDAPTLQDLLLAMIPADPTLAGARIMPSLHRPDLINFLADPTKTNIAWQPTTGYRDVRRSAIFRPMPWDHPKFTGSNPAFQGATDWLPGPDGKPGVAMTDDDNNGTTDDNSELGWPTSDDLLANDSQVYPSGNPTYPNLANSLLVGPWDVDNDGDGVAESIWIDPGLPVMTAPNGRRYKRLFAILVRDLDGRININTAGNLALSTRATTGANYNRASTNVLPYYMPIMPGPLNPTSSSNMPNFPSMGPAPNAIKIPRGLGFGPAEMDFAHILNDDLVTYTNLLYGRYGTDKRPGVANIDDPQSANKAFSHLGSSLGASSPPDVWGRGAFGVSFLGQPLYYPVTNQGSVPPYTTMAVPGGYFSTNHNIGTAEFSDDPYEAQTDSRRARNDTPYTVGELERLLRYRDGDASSLPKRINELTGAYLSTDSFAQIRRQMLTAISSHLPVPKTVPIETMKDRGLSGYLDAGTTTILDIFYNKLANPVTPKALLDFRREVPWELRQGRLFNLNRPFGNGIHDVQPGSAMDFYGNTVPADPYGVVDDPSEFFLGYSASNPPQSGQMNASAEKVLINGNLEPMWHRGDEPVPPTWPAPPGFSVSSADPRQLYCRHLYCLLWYLLPEKVDFDGDGNDDLSTAAGRISVARRLAQWAVNVVDFRDPDSINTAFEYDENPFDGWDVDGDLTTEEGGASSTNRGVVWGMERPEMLITEALAFHDRRTEDLSEGKKVTDSPQKDDDYDSHYRPQAGTFIELYNPWHSYGSQEKLPPELYANGGIALNRRAPDGTPVWRIIVVAGKSHNDQTDPDGENYKTNPGMGMGMGLGLQKKKPQSLPASDVVRSVYFTDPSGYVAAATAHPKMGSPKHGKAYYRNDSLPLAPLMPGRYAVAGSSNWDKGDSSQHVYTTYMGRLQNALATDDPPAGRRIELRPNGSANVTQVVIANNLAPNNEEIATADVPPPIALPINMRASDKTELSFSLTEPYNGYPNDASDPQHAWTSPPSDKFLDVPGDYSPNPYDEPLDKSRTDTEPDRSGNDATWWDILKNDQTVADFRTLYLQRLANPLLPWDPDTNPYLTVDASSVDLTCFNGIAKDNNDPENTPQTVSFQSFQRGGSYRDNAEMPTYNVPDVGTPDMARKLWKRQAVHTSADIAASPTEIGFSDQHFFPYPVFSTLGYINSRYYPYFTGSDVGSKTADFAGAPMPKTVGGGLTPKRIGQSEDAFPWLPFFNRPFMNPAEVLLVPNTSPSRFTKDYDFDPSGNPYAEYGKPFPFLLNAFHSDQAAAGMGSATEGATFCRLFDFVETANPYVDQETYFNPASGATANTTHFGGTQASLGMPTSVPVVKHDGDYQMALGYANFSAANGYRPPFNFLSKYREPGRINLNTIFDEYFDQSANVWRNLVFESVTKQVPGLDDPNSGFRDGLLENGRIYNSRRGPLESDVRYSLNNNSPMLIGNPYRAADLHNIMPNAAVGTSKLRKDTAIESTLLRPDYSATTKPLIRDTSLYASQSFMNVGRNPYFAYQPLGKMMNMVTTNSNCYAIWITVGYFEVEEAGAPNYIYPDGYRLGMEIGADSGEIKRHRAFYVVDRSIPVGFEPGEDHNVDKCVLLRRVIE